MGLLRLLIGLSSWLVVRRKRSAPERRRKCKIWISQAVVWVLSADIEQGCYRRLQSMTLDM